MRPPSPRLPTLTLPRCLLALSLVAPWGCAGALPIVPDGLFGDWGAEAPIHTDPSGDNGSDAVDFGRLWAANDGDRLYLRLEVGAEIEFQEDNAVVCHIDSDNNPATGLSVGGIGAEFSFAFGDRQGSAHTPGGAVAGTDNWFEFGLRSEPTTTGTEFEIAFDRSGQVGGVDLFQGSTVAILFRNEVSGVQDRLPDTGQTVTYTFDATPVPAPPVTPLERVHPEHVRVVSHNTLNDGLLDGTRGPIIDRLHAAIAADILCFQELYTTTAEQASQSVAANLGGAWHTEKVNDCITVSRWPILDAADVTGNLYTLIDLPDSPYETDLAIINAHLPCCSNETARQDEVDAIMALVRDLTTPGGARDLPAGTPIVITGDMNFVGLRQQLETMLTGDIQDNATHGADFNPDWDGSALTDAMPRHVTNDEVFTWWNPGGGFAPGRLDFGVFTDSVMEVARSYVLWTPTMPSADLSAAGLLASDSTDAADHAPVVVDLIPPGAPVPAGLSLFGAGD